MEKEKIAEKIYCNICKLETNHQEEWRKDHIEYPFKEDDSFQLDISYQLFTCKGCDFPTLRTTTIPSEPDFDIIVNYYPKRNERVIRKSFSDTLLPQKIKLILNETLEAYNNEQRLLCASGIRSIIEAVCSNENIEIKGLDKKIDALEEKGIITTVLKEGLHENRLLGNKSVHQIEVFEDRELLAAIELIQMLLESHYIMPTTINTLKRRKNKTQ